MALRKYFRVYLLYGVILPAALFAIASLLTADREPAVYKNSRILMGTVVEISVSGCAHRDNAAKAMDAAFAEIERLEGKFSAFKKTSIVCRINGLPAGEALPLDDETLYVIDKAIRYDRMTEGAFDITVKPLVDLWGFSTHRSIVPTESRIAAALQFVGTGHIILDKAAKTVSFDKNGVMIDLGAIAKGYASDRAIEVLKARGIKNAIVRSGGNIYCLGEKAPGKKWKVGIQHPRKRDSLIAELAVENAAVDTSGDYEKFFLVGSKRFCHIMDPKTGMPVSEGPASATVIAPHAMEADALATAFMVLGYERGAKVMGQFRDIEWLVTREVNGKIEIYASQNIGKFYAKKK